MRTEKYKKSRFWAVYDEADNLICLCVYRKGALAVIKQLLIACASQR